jgi:hypothetical protein
MRRRCRRQQASRSRPDLINLDHGGIFQVCLKVGKGGTVPNNPLHPMHCSEPFLEESASYHVCIE